MIRRLIDLFLIVVLLAVGVWAWSTARERSRLQSEHDRLIQSIGELPISDPAKVQIRAIPTGEPLHFAWRVYLPANYPWTWRTSTGGDSSNSSSTSREFIARVRIRETQGKLEVYDHELNGSSRGGLGDKALAQLIRGRTDQIRVKQLGTDQIVAIGPGETAVLLQLTLSEELEAEGRKTLDYFDNHSLNPVIFRLELGPEKRKPASNPPEE
jgi:hypothetical protein